MLRHRPRLLRFWVLERKSQTYAAIAHGRSTLLYIGRRDDGDTPLLVLGIVRGERLRHFAFELTWYPSGGLGRRAPRELLKLTPSLQRGPLHLWVNVVVWPGANYGFQTGCQIKPRQR